MTVNTMSRFVYADSEISQGKEKAVARNAARLSAKVCPVRFKDICPMALRVAACAVFTAIPQ